MAETSSARDPFEICGVTIDGKYRVASVVGDGGFGVVYRGVHKGFGELIAIKCLKLPTDLVSEADREELLERLRDEGRLLHRLSRATPGIVQALDVGAFTSPSNKWVPYLVMEWLEGQTLAEWMKERFGGGGAGLSPLEAVRLLDPAARALAVAHQQKIAHRDVKPANLFVSDVGGKNTVKVLDFGIAKVLSDHGSFTTALEATGTVPTAFTPRYGAPEQFNKKRGASGPWTDVFALALIYVELVTGRRALEGDDATQLYVASADPDHRPTLRSGGIETVDADAVDAVLIRALEVEPRKRYPEVGVFWDALIEATGAVVSRGASDADIQLRPASDAERAERARTVVANAKPSMPVSPTLPVESLRSDRPGTNARARALGDDSPTPAPSRSLPGSDDDPMAETPPERRGTDSHRARSNRLSSNRANPQPASEADRPPESERSGRSPWLWLSLLVLVGGAAFAYTTWTSGPKPHRPSPPDQPIVTSNSSVAPPVKPPPVAPSATPSATELTDAGAEPIVEPTPDDMLLLEADNKTFLIDRYEVTVRAYAECVAAGKCEAAEQMNVGFLASEGATDPSAFVDTWRRRCNASRAALDHPVNCLPLKFAQDYCAFRDRRLPTDQEWTFAARGEGDRIFPWGGRAPSCEGACFDRNDGCLVVGELVATCAAGTHPADRTPEGAYDMGGNVSEWVTGGKIRGGSFLDAKELLKGQESRTIDPTSAHVTIGFRCAKDGPAPEDESEKP